MAEYLFRSIPKILFEPLAVTALLWIVLTLFFFRRRDRVLYWGIFASVVFMLTWRLAFSFIMLSSRYASFLIYPGVIFSACLCVKAPLVFHRLFRKPCWDFPGKRTVGKLLSAGIFIGLTAACIGKTLHTNPYGDFVGEVVKTYRKEAKRPFYIHTQEAARIAWYTGTDLKDIQSMRIKTRDPALPFIRQRVGGSQNIPGHHYFFYYLTKGETAPSPESLKDVLAGGTWDILDRRYVSRRKNREFILAVYTPVCPNIEEWTGKIPAPSPKNVLRNGDFERVLQGKPLNVFFERCRKNGVPGYSGPRERALPAGWWLGVGGQNKDDPPDIRLSDQSPLAGKYSLCLDSRPPRKTAIVDTWFDLPGGQGRFSLWIKALGTSRSKVRLLLKARGAGSKTIILRELTFLLDGGKTYHIRSDFSTEASCRKFCLQLAVDGCVTVDQVSAVPL